MHVMCRMRRRIHACHVSYEEEDTCMSCGIPAVDSSCFESCVTVSFCVP
jgi:hypothetical protein